MPREPDEPGPGPVTATAAATAVLPAGAVAVPGIVALTSRAYADPR